MIEGGILEGLGPGVLVGLHVASFAGFLISTILGVGGAMLMLPVLVSVLPAGQAVAIVAPVMLFNNLLKSAAFWRSTHRKVAVLACLTCMPVAYIAAQWAAVVDEAVIKIGLATLILGALALERMGSFKLKLGDRGMVGAGVVMGAASGLCGAAGAPCALAMRAYGLTKEAFVGTIAVIAAALQVAKIPAYVQTGLLEGDVVWLALSLSFVACLTVPLGRAVLRRTHPKRFRVWLDALLFALALYLLGTAVIGGLAS